MLAKRVAVRPLRVLLAILLLALVGSLVTFRHDQHHVLNPSLVKAASVYTPGGAVTLRDADLICDKHGFRADRQDETARPRRVYDLFLFSNELQWLEIRLNTLAPYVDYFVIVESSRTFTNMPKPLVLKDNWDKFATFHHKMLHFVIEDEVKSLRSWDHEDFFMNSLLTKTFPTLAGTDKEAAEGDALVVGHVDEIPKPATIMLLRHCQIPDRLMLRSHFYYYSFQWMHRGEQWARPSATVYHGLKNTILPNDLRNGDGGPEWFLLRPFQRWRQKADLYNAAWHCSWCFSTIAEMLKKMETSSHTPWNTPANRDRNVLVNRVRQGVDVYGREGEYYDKVEGNTDVPDYILDNHDRFGYMLDRNGQGAGFLDWSMRP